jgi:acyl-CoA reductase-like NAD-dependent aldehyde dehydrogenase
MVLPVLVGGNAAIAVASAMDPRSAILLAECMATSDFPGALVQVLTGFAEELAPVLASHREVAALVLCSDNPTLRSSVEAESSASVKRVFVSEQMPASFWREEAQGLGWVERCMETKSIWHPRGI